MVPLRLKVTVVSRSKSTTEDLNTPVRYILPALSVATSSG